MWRVEILDLSAVSDNPIHLSCNEVPLQFEVHIH